MKKKLLSFIYIIVGFAVTLVAVCFITSLLDSNMTFSQAMTRTSSYVLALICALTAFIVLSKLSIKK